MPRVSKIIAKIIIIINNNKPNINSIIKTAAKIAEELANQTRRVTQNRMEYSKQRQSWESV